MGEIQNENSFFSFYFRTEVPSSVMKGAEKCAKIILKERKETEEKKQNTAVAICLKNTKKQTETAGQQAITQEQSVVAFEKSGASNSNSRYSESISEYSESVFFIV